MAAADSELPALVECQPLAYAEALAKANKEYKFHPFCLLFPLMGEAELSGLAEDIKANGLQKTIVLLNGDILDGRNRLIACFMAGVEPQFREWDGEGSPLDWVMSENLHRRHLTSMQRAVLACDLLPTLEADAKERQRLSPGRGEKVAKESATSEQGKASEIAAKALQTNATYVEFAKKLAGEAPDVLEQVRSGVLDYRAAKTLLTLPAERRQALLIDWNGPSKRITANIEGIDFVAARAPALLEYIRSGKINASGLRYLVMNVPPVLLKRALKESNGDEKKLAELLNIDDKPIRKTKAKRKTATILKRFVANHGWQTPKTLEVLGNFLGEDAVTVLTARIDARDEADKFEQFLWLASATEDAMNPKPQGPDEDGDECKDDHGE